MVLLPVVAAGAESAVSQADDGSTRSDAAQRILYRRIFVPAENFEAWPRDGKKYLPVEAADFDAWVSAANKAERGEQSMPTIAKADYFARFDGDRLVAGQGTWTIDVRDQSQEFLALGDIPLAIRDARWQGESRRPARIGMWGSSGSQAKTFGLEAPQTGTLEFTWDAPLQVVQGTIEIPLRLPSATQTRLVLELPAGKDPRIEGGMVLSSKPIAAERAGNSAHFWRWELALGTPLAETLQIVDANARPAVDNRSPVLRDEVNYLVTQRGLEILATWRFDDLPLDRRQLVVPLPRGVQLASVVCNERELAVKIGSDPQLARRQAIIKLDPSDSGPLKITARAWQPLVLESKWRLPKLRPESVFWSAGEIELAIESPFELRDLATSECAQTSIEGLEGDPITPRTQRFSAYAPSAELDLTLADRPANAMVRSGLSLTLAEPNLTGRLITHWTVPHGSHHRLTGDVATGWLVDSVETIPSSALGEWFIDPIDGRERIVVQLAQAATPTRDVSVIVTGRLERSDPVSPIDADSLRMIRWQSARVERHLVAMQTAEPYAVEPLGELPLAPRAAIQDADLALLDEAKVDGPIFDLSRAADQSGLKLSSKHGRYEAEIRLDATCTGSHIRQAHHLSIVSTNRIGRLLVYSTAPLGDGVRWADESSDAPIVATRLPADDPRMSGLPGGGEMWLIESPQSSTRTIDIVATVTSPWPKRTPLPLMSLREADAQRGRVLVRGEVDEMPALEFQGMRAFPLPAERPTAADKIGLPPIRAAYRYDPADCVDPSRAPRLWAAPRESDGTPSVIAHDVKLESFCWPDGGVIHRVVFFIESARATEIEFRLPNEASLRSMSVDGRELNRLNDNGSDQKSPMRAKIPAGTASVSIMFDTQDAPLAAGRRLVPPAVVSDVAIQSGNWTIWLPEEFAAIGGGVSPAMQPNWRQRVFGPLGRPDGANPFRPLQAADWKRAVGSVVGQGTADPTNLQELPGWREYRAAFVAAEPAPVEIAHPPATTTWGLSTLVLCALSGRWIRRQGRHWFIALLGVAAALCLLLPDAFVPVATGAILGLLLSLVLVLPRRPSRESESVATRVRRSSVVAVPVAVVFVMANAACAQDSGLTTSGDEPGASAPIHRVFIPVDRQGKAKDSRYFVDEELLGNLMRYAAPKSALAGDWLLVNARYLVELRERSESPDVVAGETTIEFTIEVLARDATIVLPLVPDEATWSPSAMLDGVPVPLSWREDGCAVEVVEPGRYSLIISCTPRPTISSGSNVIKLSIPRLKGSKLRVEYPMTLTGVRVAGLPPRGEANGPFDRLEHDLDGSGKFEVQWPAGGAAPSGGQGLRVTRLGWLRVGDEEISLDTKFVFEGSGRRPESLLVAFESSWELVREESADSDFVNHAGDGLATVRVPLAPDEVDRQEVHLRWRLLNGKPPCRLRMPRIELVSIPVSQRWLAVSTVSGMDSEYVDGGISAGTAPEFLAMWRGSDVNDVPQLVLRDAQPAGAGILSIRPRLAESTINESLHLAAGKTALRVLYEARVAPGTQHRYQFPLIVSPEISIDGITLIQAGRQAPSQWSRFAEDRVNVFFGEEMVGEYSIVVSGSTPIKMREAVTLPQVSAGGRSVQNVHIYREANVLVEMQGLTESLPSTPAEPPAATWGARLVAAYRHDAESAPGVRLAIRENRVRADGHSQTRLLRERSGWSAAFACRLRVNDGLLDSLQLQAPKAWAGPFTVESNVAATVETTTLNERNAVLTVRFADAIAPGHEVDLSIGGPLIVPPESTVAVPQMAVDPRIEGNRFIVVPSSIDERAATWYALGVRRAELPAALRSRDDSTSDVQTFEIVSTPYRLELQPQTSVRPSALVRLADTSVSSDAHGRRLIDTRLVVESQGVPDASLRLPPDQELVALKLDGRPALARRAGADRWHVGLGPEQFPCLLEVVTRDVQAQVEARPDLRRPVLFAGGIAVPVEINLWSFGCPKKSPTPRVEGAATTTALDQSILRFERMLSIAEAATPVAINAPFPDGYNWFGPWAEMLAELRQHALEMKSSSLDRSIASQVSNPSDEQLSRVSERLDDWIEQCEELLSGRALEAAVSPWQAELARPAMDQQEMEWSYWVADGGADRLRMEFVATTSAVKRSRVFGLTWILGLAGAAIVLARQRAVRDVLYRWPQAVGLLAGIVWWAWLWPSWCGLLIAAASLFMTWRSRWSVRTRIQEGSTVLRSGPR